MSPVLPPLRHRSLNRRRHRLAGWATVIVTGSIAVAVIPAAHSSAAGTINVTTEYDGHGQTVSGIGGGAGEGSQAVFEVQNGGVIRNVTIGATTDGVHCRGTCTLENVHWQSVGDDAATAYGGSGTVMTVRNSSVGSAVDKAFQHNGGGTVVLENITAGTVGHLYASCGNCSSTSPRSVVASDVTVDNAKYDAFAVQERDNAPQLTNITVKSGRMCTYYNGNSSNGRTCATTSSTGGSTSSTGGSTSSTGGSTSSTGGSTSSTGGSTSSTGGSTSSTGGSTSSTGGSTSSAGRPTSFSGSSRPSYDWAWFAKNYWGRWGF